MNPAISSRILSLLLLCTLGIACEEDKGDSSLDLVDEDGDGVVAADDCDDTLSWVYPGATEACDGIDNDCDGEVDEDLARTFYMDADSDGYGDEASTVEDCEAPSGAVSDSSDCDDGDAEIHPGAVEECDEIDNDCDSEVDEDVMITVYADADGDGYGEDSKGESACEAGSGQVEIAGDCDDSDSEMHPGASEICDGMDNDCDDLVDDDDVIDDPSAETFYADADDDNSGDPDSPRAACEEPEGYVDNADDCDDDDRMIKPDGLEICDGIDNDCDELIDDADDSLDTGTAYELYPDVDGDGYGDESLAEWLCDTDSAYVSVGGDCDDTDDRVYESADEECDEVDNDCDGEIDEEDVCDEPEETEWTTLDGVETFEFSEGGAFGDRNCELLWLVQGSLSSLSCTDCVFTFDVEASYRSGPSTDDGSCTSLATDRSYTYGYVDDYDGYGPYMMYYDSYYGDFSPSFAADFDSSTGELDYTYGYEDWDYYGDGTYYTYLLMGEVELGE
jgi:hypothetical protein